MQIAEFISKIHLHFSPIQLKFNLPPYRNYVNDTQQYIYISIHKITIVKNRSKGKHLRVTKFN